MTPAHTTATGWQHRIDHAFSAATVADVARDFLASFDPVELARLPDACRPPRQLLAEDIAPYAFDLVRQETASAEASEIVHALARFFSLASVRMAQLSA
jgi:hypothetical protein